MASIKKVTSYIDDAQRHLDSLLAHDADPDVVAALNSLHSALTELAAIVRSDRV